MILGVATSFTHKSPKEWAKKHKELGCKAVVFPVNCEASPALIDDYCNAAKEENLLIAEVGVWKNTLAADVQERKKNITYAVEQLRLADRIGANCCVNIVGTPHGPIWDGAYAGNYSKETWQMIVQSIQTIIDEAAPTHTKYTIEPMPWMIPSGPDEYLRLIEDVQRDNFGVHLDFVNMIQSPKRYLFAEEFMEECFEKLHGQICSCHLKDVLLLKEFTFQLRECACGKGTLNLERYAELATKERKDMPMIIEHLDSEAEYIESLQYVKERLKEVNH
ncbi:sugar phosphate isomerase/epimerase family protein [Anaerosporobacter faecicola]|uniref:sugar phosphate isomerase/epimerase family protein n=1 Tax=Anaerosporobacter faecicola TaxID=2718714 RepID=UPI00143C531E|nr:TIM barrel protein [Anaerosporobacter faecicola]